MSHFIPLFGSKALTRSVLTFACFASSLCSASMTAEAANLTPSVLPQAQRKGKPAPEGQTGLAVGKKAPELGIKDQNGKKRTWKEFLGKGKRVAVVFHRSIRW